MQFRFTRLSDLPIQVAERVELLVHETNERVLVWTALEIAEATLRWTFATTVASLHERHGGLSQALLKKVSDGIQRPTFGQWIALNKATSDEILRLKDEKVIAAEFARYFQTFLTDPVDGNLWESIHQLRNNIVHGGGLTSSKAKQFWKVLSGYLERLLGALADCHSRYELVAMLDGNRYDLMGIEQTVLEGPKQDSDFPNEDDTRLIRRSDRQSVSLRPLLTYEPIDEVWEIGQYRSSADTARDAVPQSYFKLMNDKIFYIPIGVDDFVSTSGSVDAFKQLFPEPSSSGHDTIHDQLLTAAKLQHLPGFVGRTEEIADLEAWLADTVPRGDHLGLVVGGPGLGKSAFIANLAVREIERNVALSREDYRVVFHSFNAENPVNDRRLFLQSLRQQLQKGLSRRVSKSKDILDVVPAEASVRDLLGSRFSGLLSRIIATRTYGSRE
jgi:hypothetical protein